MNNISIIGIGRLGICTALCFESKGYNVVGVDTNESYVRQINNKTLQSPEPLVEEYLQKSRNFRATTVYSDALEHSDLIMIYVPTPSVPGAKSYDHSILSKVLQTINSHKVKNKHVVIGCTIIPGYIKEVGTFLLQDCDNTTLSYNPEFIAQGNIIHDTENPDMILIGQGSPEAGQRLAELYSRVSPRARICRMSPASAEITKLGINCFVTTKVSFANMIGDIADRTHNADKNKILAAIGSDSRIGSKYLRAGYGFGGPCFPRDNRALGYYADKVGVKPIIPIATDESNKLHTQLQIEQIISTNMLPSDVTWTEDGTLIFENVCYKNNCLVPIIEESQKLVIAEALARRNYRVVIRDRENIITEVKKEFGRLFHYDVI